MLSRRWLLILLALLLAPQARAQPHPETLILLRPARGEKVTLALVDQHENLRK